MDGLFYGLLFLNPKNIARNLALICFSYRPLEPTKLFRDIATKIMEVARGYFWQKGYVEGTLKPNTAREGCQPRPLALVCSSGSQRVALGVTWELLGCTPMAPPRPTEPESRNGVQETVSHSFKMTFLYNLSLGTTALEYAQSENRSNPQAHRWLGLATDLSEGMEARETGTSGWGRWGARVLRAPWHTVPAAGHTWPDPSGLKLAAARPGGVFETQ